MNPYLAKMKANKAKMDEMLALAKKEERVFTAEEQTAFDTLQNDYDTNRKMAENLNKTNVIDNDFHTPANDSTPRIEITDKREGPFNCLTQQLSAIKNMANGTATNEDRDRLEKVNTILGNNTSVGKDGGFAVQSDFAGMMIDTAVKDDPLLSLVDTYSVSAGSNAVEWVDVDEKGSIETYVFGGVKVYWTAEGGSTTATMPQLKEKKLELQKLMGLAYATYELSEDANSFTNQLYSRAFNTAIRRELAGCIFSGTGVGKPLGFNGHAAAIAVPKETGQEADTIVLKNISKMYHRNMNKTKSVWVMHPDAAELIDFLEFPVGTGGVPVFLPATMAGSVDTLRGRPIIESDHCSAIGDLGDINFIDPKEYLMIYKGGVKTDTSIHVQFLTAQNAFRFIFRANGMPKVPTTMKIKNSSNERSPYVQLAAR